MYFITVESDFDSAHYLRNYGGKCETLHGHTFRAAATVKATRLDDIGLAYDFAVLKRQLKEIINRFDHHCLNEVAPFDKVNPSSENLATTIFNELQPKLAGTPVSLVSVEVWESPTSHVTYKPD